jgi:hypothetical protein
MKPIQCTSLLIEGFPIVLRVQQEAYDLGDISVTNKTKQNNLPSFKDRYSILSLV